MNLVCYLPWGHEIGAEQMLRFCSLTDDRKVEIIRGIDDLARRLALPRVESVVLLAMPATRRELADMQSMPALLRGIPLVMGLPDDDPETMALAHRLLPRYAIPVNGIEDYEAMSGVIARILKKYGWQGEPQGRMEESPAARRER